MKKILISFCLIAGKLLSASEQVNVAQDATLKAVLLQGVCELNNSREIGAMTHRVDTFKEKYAEVFQQREQKIVQNNQSMQLLESEIASYNAQTIIQDFMKNPESAYYHKTSQWSDEMHKLTFEMIKSRAAFKRDPGCFDWQNRVRDAETSLLACLLAGGFQYLYPEKRAVQIKQLADMQQALNLNVIAQSRLADQCKVLDVVALALVNKKQSRQLYLEKSWQKFTENLVAQKQAQVKQAADAQKRPPIQ